MNVAQSAKEILLKVKSLFTEAPAAVAAVPQIYKLKDGSEISISIKDPSASMAPEIGDAVTIAGAPAPAAEYEIEDGTKITVDMAGAITAVIPAAPVTQTPEEMAAAEAARVAALAQPTGLTAEAVRQMIADALQAFKESFAPMQQQVATQTSQLQAAAQKIEKQDEIIKGFFAFAEELVKEPTAEPKTLTGAQKERFDKMKSKDEKFEKRARAITDLKNKNKNPAAVQA